MLTEQAPNNSILVSGCRPLILSPHVYSLPLRHFHTHIKIKYMYNKVIIYYKGDIIIFAAVKYFPPFKNIIWQNDSIKQEHQNKILTWIHLLIEPTAHNTPHNYINISTLSVIPTISTPDLAFIIIRKNFLRHLEDPLLNMSQVFQTARDDKIWIVRFYLQPQRVSLCNLLSALRRFLLTPHATTNKQSLNWHTVFCAIYK